MLFLFTVATESSVSSENILNSSGIFSKKSRIFGVLATCFLSSSGSRYFWLKYTFCEVYMSTDYFAVIHFLRWIFSNEYRITQSNILSVA